MMKIAVRGEGATDIGRLLHNGCFEKGPMVMLTEKLDCYKRALCELGYDEGLNADDFIQWHYIHKETIKKARITSKKSILRGKKEHRASGDLLEIKGFFEESNSFASLAREVESSIAIFFVDTDKAWCDERYRQAKAGLKVHGFDSTGIPMIPVKISEAWLMCSLSRYQDCARHEEATTDKRSPHYPKNLCDASGKTRHEIADECDPNRINMPSFNRFKEELQKAIETYFGRDIFDS